MTSILSPGERPTSSILRMKLSESSEMWQKPSRPGWSSTKMPKGITDLTSPVYVCPMTTSGRGFFSRSTSAMIAEILSMAIVIDRSVLAVMDITPSARLRSMLSTPVSSIMELMVLPSLPMIAPQ
eukprot:CAMPEP_0185559350 /NCGR_PEP_ID=MMETSP1381-20130426/54377_1 /TAXON_ID=298111 /ORGANISM="Pavlova sp., Strain CCMP459" /LENGTH=124 /DNA_ID=CAMNT_0028172961 /DNA_START=74 /DNA_END=448 /DNA_ORIENTATION=+